MSNKCFKIAFCCFESETNVNKMEQKQKQKQKQKCKQNGTKTMQI